MSASSSISETPSGRSRGRSSRTDDGICENRSSSEPSSIASSISRTSSSVWGANLIRNVSLAAGHPDDGLGRPRRNALRRAGPSARDVLEPVLRHERQVVALVEDLAVDPGVQLAQAPNLAVLLRDELLVQRRDLDVQVVHRQVEVGCEALRRAAVAVPLEIERPGLVLPIDLIEVEQLRELALAGVGETEGVALGRGYGRSGLAHAPPAEAVRGRFRFCFAIDPSRSVHTLSTAIAK